MHQADGSTMWIEKKNGAAIRDVNPETDIALVSHEAVASVDAAID